MGDNKSVFQSGVERSLPLIFSALSPSNLLRFISDLQTARFIVPIEGESMKIVAAVAENYDNAYIAAFTSESELAKSGAATGFAAIVSYLSLKQMLADDLSLCGIAIDPFGARATLDRDQIESADRILSHISERGLPY